MSIGALQMGTAIFIFFEKFVVISISWGSTSEKPGKSTTSSNVIAMGAEKILVENMQTTPLLLQ